MSNNHIPLYRKIDSDLLNLSKFSITNTYFSYRNSDEDRIHSFLPSENQSIYMNEIDNLWNPSDYNLYIHFSVNFEKFSNFFTASSVVNKSNEIGIAARVYSKASSFQEVFKLDVFDSTFEKINKDYIIPFKAGMLRDSVSIELFMYVSKINKVELGKANNVGTILNDEPLYKLNVFVDGEGSVFPITEFKDPNGPLWILEKSWFDSEVDTFDSTNVRLALNIEHDLFEQINTGRTKLSRKLMNDIVTHVIGLIIQDVVIIENKDISIAEETAENSILRMVKYWVDTFDVDTSSIIAITNSLNKNLNLN